MQVATPRNEHAAEAAPAEPGAKRTDSKTSERFPGLFGRLRDLRAVAQNLRAFAVTLGERTAAIADATSRKREAQVSIQEGAPVLSHDGLQAERRLAEIRENIERDDEIYSAYGDIIARVEASWQEALTSWPLDQEEYIAQLPQRLPKFVAALDAIIYDCGLITLPSRICDHLALMPIGGSLGFREAYEDELPKPEDQRRFLQYLSLYPGFVEGLVDVGHGCIYRADPRGWRRALSLWVTLAIALLGFGVIWGARLLGEAFNLSDWPFTLQRSSELLSAYVFLLLGAAGHVVVNMLKKDRAENASTRGLADWLLRVHVKETSFWASAATLALAPLAMAFLFKSVDWKTAFFFGYSYDSFIDLFLQRFEGAAASAAETMKKL